jgi:hypothetical protein
MKNTKYTVFALSALLMFGLTTFTHAATYEYVNTSRSISVVTADSPSQAISKAVNIAPHSGVILVSGGNTIDDNNTTYRPGNVQYGYVNEFGVIVAVDANTSTQAFAGSNNISDHSGVILINSTSDENLIGDTMSTQSL